MTKVNPKCALNIKRLSNGLKVFLSRLPSKLDVTQNSRGNIKGDERGVLFVPDWKLMD